MALFPTNNYNLLEFQMWAAELSLTHLIQNPGFTIQVKCASG